jgi:hypothetical protein
MATIIMTCPLGIMNNGEVIVRYTNDAQAPTTRAEPTVRRALVILLLETSFPKGDKSTAAMMHHTTGIPTETTLKLKNKNIK